MAIEIRHFTLTIPAGTPASAPVRQDMSFPPRDVEWIQVVAPSGSSGLIGWAVQVSGITVIPYNSDPYVITSGENITWPMEDYPDTGAWSVIGYNQGNLAHSVYFRFGCVMPATIAPAAPSSIDETVLNAQTSAATGSG